MISFGVWPSESLSPFASHAVPRAVIGYNSLYVTTSILTEFPSASQQESLSKFFAQGKARRSPYHAGYDTS